MGHAERARGARAPRGQPQIPGRHTGRALTPRVAILIDRAPDDPEWKGAAAWDIVRDLSACPLDVAVFTTLDPATLDGLPARVPVSRPAPTFGLDRLPAWLRALAGHRPGVIHSIGLRTNTIWPAFAAWPWLDAATRLFPGCRRIVSGFDAADFRPVSAWLRGAARATAPDAAEAAALRAIFGGPIDVVPYPAPGGDQSRDNLLLVPTPVSEWADAPRALADLADRLRPDPTAEAVVFGGWGDVPASERRSGWRRLGECAARVRMREGVGLAEFRRAGPSKQNLFIPPSLRPTWRSKVAAAMAAGGGQGESAANHFSRLYST